MSLASINPTNGETLKIFEPLTASELDGKLNRAVAAFVQWRRVPFSERAALLNNAAQILEDEQDRIGRIMVTEMGKPLKAARAEAAKCATGCRYYAENAARILADEEVKTDASRSYVRYQPLGAILAIMPWNFPFWQVFRFAAPALMAGNVGLLKHASSVPQCALEIEDVFQRAGFPPGVFQSLLIGVEATETLLDDPCIAAATLTGSEGAGAKIAARAGKNIKKTVLELGGSDPYIVMPSADIKKSAQVAVTARCQNNGQSCIAAKRFIVHQDIYDEWAKLFVRGMEALKVGDPLDEENDMGPLATPEILQSLDEQVQKLVEGGAKILTGGKRLSCAGNFYVPTVISEIPRQHPTAYEELFGPVAMLYRVRNLDEAIELANDSTFGLGSAAWTNDEIEIARCMDEIEAGQVFINGMVASDARLPFGGVKKSGYGRELGEFGIREFVNIKTVWKAQSPVETQKEMAG